MIKENYIDLKEKEGELSKSRIQQRGIIWVICMDLEEDDEVVDLVQYSFFDNRSK